MPPRRCAGGNNWRRKNMEYLKFGHFWWMAFVLQIVSDIYIRQHTPNTPPVLGQCPNCQCSTTPHKAVCTSRNLHCLSDWMFACCKTVEDPYCPVTVLYLQSQFNVLHYSRVSKFCIKFENFAWNLVSWFSGKSVNLLQPDVRF